MFAYSYTDGTHMWYGVRRLLLLGIPGSGPIIRDVTVEGKGRKGLLLQGDTEFASRTELGSVPAVWSASREQ